ncbi:DUF1254 domain-containing protein [Streptomyces sp. RKAG290]|uniref:DUF1254 domain-containing protein n=1 Tax=Streptomyces sp. RKAG290 TaxID=2888348 RepID=UPI002034134A|nr:DUF1254 domain-containing protein [Streptomyces sp. RKAG290]MCM2414376.1 DUF1254 domain-containing protein [Streptomyces sp. RKAG290]
MSEENTHRLVELAAEAYVYGYPLVFDLTMVETCLHKGFGSMAPAPFNHFTHSDRLADAGAHFVSVNNDTVYSIAQLDLSGGPVRLHVPDTVGAYYVMQFVDAWSNNFAYVGRRATGTEAGDWLVVPPGWAGTVPGDVRGVIDAPTSVVTIVGRNACDGPDDLAQRVRPLQEQLTLTHLEPGEHRTGLPAPDAGVPEALRFFEQLRVWMADFPPSAADRAYQDRFQPLGLLEEGPSPYVPAGAALVRALTEGLALGKERVEAASRPGAGDGTPGGSGGGWSMNPHLFDYNLDWFGVGTLDSSEWKIADREASYLARAVAARVGLWGNHGYEAVYAQTFQDADGAQLNGAHRYELRFEEPPPVEAFWSVTMYDTPDYYLVANPAGRYSVGDRTPGIVYGDDGSLTVHISRERPADPVAAANWLPAPEGDFRPMLRLYMPERSVLDGRYGIPAVRRVDGSAHG